MLAGDWHGNLPWAFKVINYAKSQGCDTILHVGDFGWFTANERTWQYLAQVNAELKHCGINLYWIDGNHEDHAFWHQFNQPLAAPMATLSYPNIIHLPRGYRWEWWGDTWMALGGAHSVDRLALEEGVTWWPGERLTQDQIDYAKRPGKVDIIVAHDAPMNASIPGIKPATQGHPLFPMAELMLAEDHRRDVQAVVDAVKPVEFYHGHYHRAYNNLCRAGFGGHWVNIRGLDRDESTIAKNTHIIDGGLDG